ncbi:MAG: RluA family pseudouridine synthase [Acidaminobacteraceae bacterium]
MDINFSDLIVYEDEYFVVVNKPCGIPTQPDKTGDLSLEEIANTHYRKELANATYTVGLIHRLDRPVGGLLILSKDRRVLVKFNDMMQKNEIKKRYRAVCNGRSEELTGTYTDYMKKLKTTSMSKIVSKEVSGSKKAELLYKCIKTDTSTEEILSLFEIELITGRHHQIRVQMSHHKNPIWGDTKYNRVYKRKGYSCIALYSAKLSFKHPINNKLIDLELALPNQFPFELFR